MIVGNGVTVTLSGGEVFDKRLEQLRGALQRRIVAGAFRAALKEILQPKAETMAPRGVAPSIRRKTVTDKRDVGPIHKSFGIRGVTKVGRDNVVVRLLTRNRKVDAYYALFVEKGYKAGRRPKRGGQDKRKMVGPRPFLGPAMASASSAMLEKIRIEISQRIELEMARNGNGSNPIG